MGQSPQIFLDCVANPLQYPKSFSNGLYQVVVRTYLTIILEVIEKLEK